MKFVGITSKPLKYIDINDTSHITPGMPYNHFYKQIHRRRLRMEMLDFLKICTTLSRRRGLGLRCGKFPGDFTWAFPKLVHYTRLAIRAHLNMYNKE